mgnify:CR=1 FL=1
MNSPTIPDQRERVEAETTFDRNVVVIAGAGTGKTTLLVNRLIHLLIKEPDPIPVTQLVALTFTNKAATEMKQRLRERLTGLMASAGQGTETEGGAVSLRALRDRYGLSSEAITARASAALGDIEKSQIGTLHSFAAHLLRLYPLESGVSPSFQEDDGLRFDEHFTQHWDVWVDRELGRQGTRHHQWKTVLRVVTLDDLRTFVRSLCNEMIDLESLRRQLEPASLDPHLADSLTAWRDQGRTLLAAHAGPKPRKVEHMLAAAVALLTRLIEQGPRSLATQPQEEREQLQKDLGLAVRGWESEEFNAAGIIIDLAQQFQSVDQQFFKDLLSLIIPLVHRIRESFAQQGWLSFDSLLARARVLLHEHLAIRDRIKREYRAVLVDEFQDTDPVQYEIVLAVSELPGTHETAWQKMALEPGKLFIVGDPKQSIYAFRRADIEAFERVVEKIEATGGMTRRLTANFRSDAALLGPVNDIFDRLLCEQPHIQPANVRLDARPRRRPPHLTPGVSLRIVTPPGDETFDAAEAVRAEAAALARWLKDDVFTQHSVKPGHVTLLFRKLTQADAYLDALRRHQIPYVIEGEKHFYRRQEIIDVVNLLRVLDHPHDTIALLGLLRSPLGGLTDRAIYDLRQAGLFDYRRAPDVAVWPHPAAAHVQHLYHTLDQLHRDIALWPLGDAIQHILDAIPVLELAAASLHGEQAVANILKMKQLAAELADRPHLTLSGFAELMARRLDEQPAEAESPLAEESPEAVQILTIHKSKGLEFPVVILPGLHQGSGRERSQPAVTHDWSSGQYGLALGGRQTVNSVWLRQKLTVREEAERRRVLYVGMTRAKDFLLLSGAATARISSGSVLFEMQAIGEGDLGATTTTALTVGASRIPHTAVPAPERMYTRRPRTQNSSDMAIDPAVIAARWQSRDLAWQKTRTVPRHLTPTMLAQANQPAPERRSRTGPDREFGRLVGILTHRRLEQCDFAADSSKLLDRLDGFVQRALSVEQQDLAPRLTAALRELLTTYGRSPLYKQLGQATILGREIPFHIPWGEKQVMEGVIDVLYRLDGRLWIADYKTDAVTPDEAPTQAERYRTQATLYKQAVQQSLGIPAAGFQCIFLRCATAVEL